MENAFSRLSKVINLERKQGYRNKAVIGGLDKFASRWEADARAEARDQQAVNEIVALLIGYPAVAEQVARERIIEQISRRLREVNADEATPSRSHIAADESAPREPAPPRHQRARTQPRQDTPQPRRERHETFARGAQRFRSDVSRQTEARGQAPKEAESASEAGEHVSSHPAPPETAEAAANQTAIGGTTAEQTGEQNVQQPAPGTEQWTEREPSRTMPARSKPEIGGGTLASPASQATNTEPAPPEPRGRERLQAEQEQDMAADADGDDFDDFDLPATRFRRRVRAEEESFARSAPLDEGRLDVPVIRLPSIGPSFAEKLARLGVHTIRDMLYLLPHRYDDFSQLRTIDRLNYGEEVTVIGTVWEIESRPIGEGRRLVNAVVGDGTGQLQMTWFNPYVERQLKTGRPYVFSGKIDSFRGKPVMNGPEFEPLEKEQVNTGRLVPVYPLTQGISGRWLRKVMKTAVDTWSDQLPDFLPGHVRDELGLLPLPAALAQIHFPDGHEMLAAAHRRLSFDEFFVLQLGVLGNRQRFRGLPARPLCADPEILAPFLASLPFRMTAAQSHALAEITADLATAQPMSRLLQGDVGSGKTAVAAAALWTAVANGTQGAIMAPTEILAEQHARSFEKMFAGLKRPGTDEPVRVALLTGRQRKAERDDLLAALAEGEIDIAVGTHALIQEEVRFRELSVAVVDEQHRFGVEQRAALRQKGTQPHMLVMSATPIPRSLALTIYGDLDVSVIGEMPAGRTPIRTKWLTSSQRERAYGFIRRQVDEGRQAFIIYPLVENSEHSEAKAAVDEHGRLQNTIFPEYRLGLLHGRLKSDEKDNVMRAFAAGDLHILVATSVVEVGIDVPNATVILIEGADRFGLAQLHQFRGRVGRGSHPSYCVLIADAAEGDSARRLQALETSNDGFALAQTDLDMRGPGDFFGTRQSGLPPLRMAQLSDLRTLEEARNAAQAIFADDPQLSQPEHSALAAQVAAFWRDAGDAS